MAAYTIRPATPRDVTAIFELVTALGEYEKLAHEMVGTPEDLHQGLFGKKPFAEAIVAQSNGRTVGFALYFYNFSTFLMKPGIYLEDLFVSPDYRRQGIATGLLNYLANHAVEQGCGRLEWSVLDWNEDAIHFYKKIGAVLMEEWTGCRLTGEALLNFAKANE